MVAECPSLMCFLTNIYIYLCYGIGNQREWPVIAECPSLMCFLTNSNSKEFYYL